MTDLNDRAVTHALDDLADALRGERPSAHLDSRLDAAIEGWAGEHRSRRLLGQPYKWAAAAASVAIVGAGIALVVGIGGRAADEGEAPLVATGSLYGPVRGQEHPGAALPREPGRFTPGGVRVDVSPAAGSAYAPPLATGGQVSLFPAEGAVFRVRASLNATPPVAGQPAPEGERQYWVDVRIANDGTMRIMQVLPAEHSRVVPLE